MNSYEADYKLSGEDQVLLSMGGTAVLEVKDGGDGAEISNDPDFTDDGLWDRLDTPLVINGGTISCDGSNGAKVVAGQEGKVVIGTSYFYEIHIDSIVGTVYPRFASNVGVQLKTPGIHTGVIDTTGGLVSALDIIFFTGSVCVVSYMSVQEAARVIGLTDGTNACSTPVVSAEPHIIATYNATDGMTLDVDGVTATSAYDGTLGAGDLSTKATQRDLIRRES